MTEYISSNIASAKLDDSLPCVFRYVTRHVDQVIDYRTMASALYRLPEARISFPESLLTDHAQDVKARMASSNTSSLVSNLPEGRRSRSMSVFSSL